MTGRCQPSLRLHRPPASDPPQLFGSEVPTRAGKVLDPLQWALEHQLGTSRAQGQHTLGKRPIVRRREGRRTQLDEPNACIQRPRNSFEQTRHGKAVGVIR